ncbi:MAG: amidohydrolase [Synergistales bacterium]|nr:amidohydrolase [Synergistales bacterium]
MNWKELQEKMIRYRRDFHSFPEAGWTEFRTSSKISDILHGLGFQLLLGPEIIELSSVMGRQAAIVPDHQKRALDQGASEKWMKRMEGFTGVVGILDTGREGPTVSLRFDIDAVEVTEATESSHRPFREGFSSRNNGVMHSCGHDGHTAIGLGLAEVLAEKKDELAGKFKLVFQPAEEGVRGSKAITDRGILDDSNFFIALHLGMGIPTGTLIGGSQGFLCTKKLDVHYHGRSAHAGAAPNEGHNSLLAAASAVLNLHAIAPHKKGVSRINVGVLNAGEGRNVIAPNADMKIEVRGESQEITDYMYQRALRIIETSAAMYEVESRIERMGESITARSDELLVEEVCQAGRSLGFFDRIETYNGFGGSDDAAWMMKRVQDRGGRSTYIILGSDIPAGHHNEFFDFDESVLVWGARVLFETLRRVGCKTC